MLRNSKTALTQFICPVQTNSTLLKGQGRCIPTIHNSAPSIHYNYDFAFIVFSLSNRLNFLNNSVLFTVLLELAPLNYVMIWTYFTFSWNFQKYEPKQQINSICIT